MMVVSVLMINYEFLSYVYLWNRYNKLDSFFRLYKIEVQKKNQVVNERENMVY